MNGKRHRQKQLSHPSLFKNGPCRTGGERGELSDGGPVNTWHQGVSLRISVALIMGLLCDNIRLMQHLTAHAFTAPGRVWPSLMYSVMLSYNPLEADGE